MLCLKKELCVCVCKLSVIYVSLVILKLAMVVMFLSMLPFHEIAVLMCYIEIPSLHTTTPMVVAKGSTWAELWFQQWQQYVMEGMGPVTSYIVQYQDRSVNGTGEWIDGVTVDHNNNQLVIQVTQIGLIPYTNYKLKVTPIRCDATSKHVGQATTEINFMTLNTGSVTTQLHRSKLIKNLVPSHNTICLQGVFYIAHL